jgi:hypothetical protein
MSLRLAIAFPTMQKDDGDEEMDYRCKGLIFLFPLVVSTVLFCVSQGCVNRHKNQLCQKINSFASMEEMMRRMGPNSELARLKKSILNDDRGIHKLTECYLSGEQVDKRTIFLAWKLCYQVKKQPKKQQLIALFLLALSDDDREIRGIAASGLVHFPKFTMKNVFIRMLGRDDMQLHGIRGLVRIGTSDCIEAVLDSCRRKLKSGESMCSIVDVMCEEGLPGQTAPYVRRLLEKGKLSSCRASLLDECKRKLEE